MFGGLRIGVPPIAGRKDHPTQEKLSLPWVAGSSYHWQGVWGGGCQSPHLPDWNWSCHLTCCVGREAKELMSKGGRGLGDFSAHEVHAG